MSKTIYIFTRQIAIIILSLFSSIILFNQGYSIRSIGNLILLLFFLATSYQYQKKFNLISASYLFIFINLYIVFSLVASYYDCAKIIELDKTGFMKWEEYDYYPIYFCSVSIAYLFILIYLKYTCKRKTIHVSDIFIKRIQIRNIYIGIALVIFAYYLVGRNDVVVIPALSLLTILPVVDKKRRKIHLCFLFLAIVVFKGIFLSRFYVVQIVFPVIVAFLMMSKKNETKYSILKLYLFFTLALGIILIYGVISEVIKLNIFYHANYKVIDFFSSKDKLLKSFMRQIYRIFIIWIKDGGYIIYHVKKNGFYYGLTYIKPVASFLGLPYINLPKIAAEYNYSTYSQTGLLVEGYSNFGIIGASINIVLVFFFMEFLNNRFANNPSIRTMSFVAIPFVNVITKVSGS